VAFGRLARPPRDDLIAWRPVRRSQMPNVLE
jgi:hypothetical protein